MHHHHAEYWCQHLTPCTGPPEPARNGPPHHHPRGRVSGPAADWITENLDTGAVVKEKVFGGSNWSSQYVYETEQVREGGGGLHRCGAVNMGWLYAKLSEHLKLHPAEDQN